MDYLLKIRELLIKAGADLNGVTYDTLLMESGVIDSLVVAQLVMEMEETFDCQFDIDEISPKNFESINAIATMIREKLN